MLLIVSLLLLAYSVYITCYAIWITRQNKENLEVIENLSLSAGHNHDNFDKMLQNHFDLQNRYEKQKREYFELLEVYFTDEGSGAPNFVWTDVKSLYVRGYKWDFHNYRWIDPDGDTVKIDYDKNGMICIHKP